MVHGLFAVFVSLAIAPHAQANWSLWLSPDAGSEVVDQSQEEFGEGSHASAATHKRVAQVFVPQVTPLQRIDVQLNNSEDERPGWVRLFVWKGDYAATTAAEALWSDVVDLSGTRGFRTHAFFPQLAVERGVPLLLEFGADARNDYRVRHVYRGADRYLAGRMFLQGRPAKQSWDLWFRTFGPPAPGLARVEPVFSPSRERRKFTPPLRAKSVDRDAYRSRLSWHVDQVRGGILASCQPLPLEAIGEALAYRMSCERGRCDEGHARATHDLLANMHAWRTCSAGHASQPARCLAVCGDEKYINSDWVFGTALSWAWTRDSPRLSASDRERARSLLARAAREAWPLTERTLNNRSMAYAAGYAWAAAQLPEDPLAAQWRAYAEEIWSAFWRAKDTEEDSASYTANVFWPSLMLLARGLGREDEFWADPDVGRLVQREFDRTAPIGVEPEFGHGAGWFHMQGARIWLFELAAKRLQNPHYKWMAHQTFEYLRRHARDQPPREDLLGRTLYFLGLAYLDSDPELRAQAPLRDREFVSLAAAPGDPRHGLTVKAGARHGVRIQPSASPLAGLELEWDPQGDAGPLRIDVWRWRGSAEASRAAAAVYAVEALPVRPVGLQTQRFDPFVAFDPADGLYVELTRASTGFALAGAEGRGMQLRALGLRETGSVITQRKLAVLRPRAPEPPHRRIADFSDEWVADKLVLRGGPDPDDTFAMFNLARGYGHGQEELGALAGLLDRGSVLFQNTPFPYWFHDGGIPEDESIPFLRRHSGGRYGKRGQHARVTRFEDGRHATVVWLEFDDPRGWGVRQERRIVFAKNRFLLVRDGYHFPDEMRVSAGPLWHVADIRPERGANWLDIYDRVPLSNVWKLRNPERYALVHLTPRAGTALEAWQQPTYLPPATCSDSDAKDVVAAECRAGPSRIVAQRWTGTAQAGSTRWFETLIVPHGAKTDPAELAAGIRVLEAGEDFAAELRLGDETWLVADLENSGSLTRSPAATSGEGPTGSGGTASASTGWQIEARSALVAVSPGRPPYVFGRAAKRIAHGALELRWPASSDLERGSVALERPIE